MTHEFHAHHGHAHSHAHGPLANLTAILIALFTLVLAAVAWRASVASYQALHADYDGLRAVVAEQEVESLATVQANAHAQMYASYRRYDEAAGQLEEELKTAKGAELEDLTHKKSEADALVDSKLKLFPNKFMDREGHYDIHRDSGEYVANESRTRDLVPDPHFKEAEAYRHKSETLLLGDVFLGVGMVFLTLVESFEGALGIAMLVLGSLAGVSGTIYSILMELAH